MSEREESEHWNFLEGLWLFMPLVKTRPMGRPWDNGLAKRWWPLGRHARQKEPAASAEVRRATQKSTFSKFQTPNRDYLFLLCLKVACCLCGGLHVHTCAPRKLPTTLPSRATRGLQALSKQASQSHAVYGALSAERFRARQGHPPRGGGRGISSRTLVGHSGVQWGTVGVPLRPPRSGARPACAP